MREVLLSWLPWNLDAILAIQQASPTWLDLAMRGITYLGSTYTILVLLSSVYWMQPALGMQVAAWVLLSAYSNTAFKTVCAIERPFVHSADVITKVNAAYYAFPSGHAQLAATLWPMLAHSIQRHWFTGISVAMVFFVGISRVILGVHYPQDVLAGWTIGIVLYLLHGASGSRVAGWIAKRSLGAQLALAIGIPLALTLLLPLEETTTATGAMLGMGIGFALNARVGRFSPSRSVSLSAGRIALGLSLIAIVYLVPKLLLEDGAQGWGALALHFLRYALVSLTGSLVAAWCFVRTELATRSRQSVTS